MNNNRDNRAILIVESDPSQQRFLAALLGRGGWRAALVNSKDEGLHYAQSEHGAALSAIVLNCCADGLSNHDFIAAISNLLPDLPVIAITENDNVDVAIRVMRAGAADFVQKPIIADRLLGALEQAINKNNGKEELRPLTEKLRTNLAFDDFVGASANFRSALAIAAKAARNSAPVLINGRSGTGKEMFAHALHRASPRARAPLMLVDCSAVSPGMIASCLFGHERGAFPGAFDRQLGQLVQADGGSIIIDHVECIPLETQARLVHFLSSGDVQMLGSPVRQHVDVRIIATSATPLDRLIDSGHFREDLFYALSAAQLTLPNLSDRRCDIAPLARHLLARIASLPMMPSFSITDEALELLGAYAWPGNVRQLQDVLFRAALASDSNILTAENFPAIQQAVYNCEESKGRARSPAKLASSLDMDLTLYQPDGHLRPLEDIEADIIRLAITHYRGHMSEVARRLGIGRSTLYRKLADLGIDTAA